MKIYLIMLRKIDAETWVKDGVVINPEFKEPSFDTLVKWKLIVTTAQNHPNVLAHKDFTIVRDLCQFFGVFITYETSDLIVEFSVTQHFIIHFIIVPK